MKLFHFREKCVFSSDTPRFPSSWTVNPRGFYWWPFPTLNFEHRQQMDVERNHQSFWKGKWRKYWTLHWLQPVACKVLFPSWCCSWSGNGWALPWGILPGLLTHTQPSFVMFSLLTSHHGLGIQPFADGFLSRVSGLITLYPLCFYHAAGSLLQPHVEAWFTAELDKYCKIKSISASGFWAGKGRKPRRAAFQGLSLPRGLSSSTFWPFFENASGNSLRGLSLSHPKLCSTHLGMWVGRSQPRGFPGCCIHALGWVPGMSHSSHRGWLGCQNHLQITFLPFTSSQEVKDKEAEGVNMH